MHTQNEGLDARVRPACTCSGGRVTSFTKTEQGGPLDTGARGAWPQDLPNHVDYIDGGSSAAYKSRHARTQSLYEGLGLGIRGAHSTRRQQLHGIEKVGLGVNEYIEPKPITNRGIMVGPEGLTWTEVDEKSLEVRYVYTCIHICIYTHVHVHFLIHTYMHRRRRWRKRGI
jgi:hypothetical protein